MKKINKILKYFVALMMFLLVCVVLAGVFFRYILQRSLFWSTELSIFLQIWIVFIGASVAYSEKSHISIDILIKRLGYKNRMFLECLCNLILISFFVLLIIKGINIVKINMTSLSEALKIPYGLIYTCVPFSASIMLLQTLLNQLEPINKRREKSNDFNTSD